MMFFKNKWQIIRFFQILCVNLHYYLKFNPINLVKLWKKIRIINSSRISCRWASALKLQMGISPEVAEGTYSNLALITHSSSDFILDFACALPGMPAPQIKSRVIMAPEHAKRLLQALQSNIYNYEQSFGKIKLSDEQERTIAPFGTPKGEA